MGWQELCEVQPEQVKNLAPGEEQPQAPARAVVYTLPNAAQNAFSLLCGKSTFLGHVQLGVYQESRALFLTESESAYKRT